MLDDLPDSMPLHCVFCESTKFVVPHEGYQPQPGEMLTCGNCGRQNDYNSLFQVLEENAVELVKKEMEKQLKSIFKGSTIRIG